MYTPMAAVADCLTHMSAEDVQTTHGAALSHVLRVLEFTNTVGWAGQLITATIEFHNPLATATYYSRIVLAGSALRTDVFSGSRKDTYVLRAVAPPLSEPYAELHVQALDDRHMVIDSVPCGMVSYNSGVASFTLVPTTSDVVVPDNSSHSPEEPGAHLTYHSSLKRRASSTRLSPVHASELRTRRQQRSILRRVRSNKRNRRSSDSDHQPAQLEVLEPLSPLTQGWDDEEVRAGRRLVRFNRLVDGCHVGLLCQRVIQQDYDQQQASDIKPRDIVISCIWREDLQEHCITSVDIICLLEMLVDGDFEIEEKNRIRRNLEYIHPTTISKGKPSTHALFNRIMEYPMPKPRTIEKDVKVFPWARLSEALDKVISKYSVHFIESSTTEQEAIEVSSPRRYPSSPPSSTYSPAPPTPELIPDEQLAYPENSDPYLPASEPFFADITAGHTQAIGYLASMSDDALGHLSACSSCPSDGSDYVGSPIEPWMVTVHPEQYAQVAQAQDEIIPYHADSFSWGVSFGAPMSAGWA